MSPSSVPSGRRGFVILGVIFAGIVALGLVGYWLFARANSVPEFSSLADDPDPSLAGTVAYLDWQMDACLLIVPAAGGEPRTVTCLEGVNAGAGAQLDWLDDGRIQVTQYGDWQKIIGPETGEVEDVPADQVPPAATAGDPGNVSSGGQQLTSTNDAGNVQIIVEDEGESRVLLDAEGGSNYRIGSPQWSPDEAFVLTPDEAARLLVTTIGDSPQTRVLATELGGDFAVTPLEP